MIYYDVELKDNYFAIGSKSKRIHRRQTSIQSNYKGEHYAFSIPGIIKPEVNFKRLLVGEYIISIPHL
jgi:hypothetical protein